jgi:acyl carrier protein
MNKLNTETILEILNTVRPECDFSGANDFFDSGLLDSFDLTVLVAALEERFAISLNGTDIVPENFHSVAAILALLGTYGVQA